MFDEIKSVFAVKREGLYEMYRLHGTIGKRIVELGTATIYEDDTTHEAEFQAFTNCPPLTLTTLREIHNHITENLM
jgi:hypothetical protein